MIRDTQIERIAENDQQALMDEMAEALRVMKENASVDSSVPRGDRAFGTQEIFRKERNYLLANMVDKILTKRRKVKGE